MSKFFWPAFNASNGRCVYCLKDLLASFEEFSQAQEDHLVPKSNGGPHSADNIVIACAVCNSLKHHHSPTTEPFSADKRSEYIAAAREIIAVQRQKKFDVYVWWVSRFSSRFIPENQQ
jgi:5-methylcytosine-specific restriction endonuclease McrA